MTVWDGATKRTYWYNNNPAGAAKMACALAKEGHDVYSTVCLLKEQLAKGRGTIDDVASLPGVFTDIDIAGPGHNTKSVYPPDLDAALAVVRSFPLTPTMIVFSGGGLQVYWLFHEPLVIATKADRHAAQTLMAGFYNMLSSKAKAMGYEIDNVQDLARVLRVPGTLNCKLKELREVKLLELNPAALYSPDEIPVLASDRPLPTPHRAQRSSVPGLEIYPALGTGDDTDIPEVVMTAIRRCQFLRDCQDNAASLPEQNWWAMVHNLAPIESGGPQAVHLLSRPYPNYTFEETQGKIERAISDPCPHTCRYINDPAGTIRFTGCPPQGCGVASPIGLATSKAAITRLDLMDFRSVLVSAPQRIMDADVIRKLALLKQHSLREYESIMLEFKRLTKGSVTIKDIKAIVDDEIGKNQARNSDNTSVRAVFPDIEDDLDFPPGYQVTGNGIFFQTQTGTATVCIVPIALTKRLAAIGGKQHELIELTFIRDGRTHTLQSERSTVFSRTSIMQLADSGLPATTENASGIVKYLNAFEQANINTIPVTRFSAQLGWISSTEFLPGVSPAVLIPAGGATSFTRAFEQKGELVDWADKIRPLRQYPYARLILAAGFASVMISQLAQRCILLHVWGGSRGGKTAAQKAAASIWGHPEKTMISFNTTNVGLEYRAGFLNNLPVVLDERQAAGTRQDFLNSLVYMFGEGQGRGRGTRNGGQAEIHEWNLLGISSGEHPISTDSSSEGLITRLVEVYTPAVIPDQALASSLHNILGDTYGSAGPEFVRQLMDFPNITAFYKAILAKIIPMVATLVESHTACLAILVAADILSAQWIFGDDEDTAINGGFQLAVDVIPGLNTREQANEATRALNYIMSWVAQNPEHFQPYPLGSTEHYGCKGGESTFVFPNALRTSLTLGGFNIERVKKDFVLRGWLKDRNGDPCPTHRHEGESIRSYEFIFPVEGTCDAV